MIMKLKKAAAILIAAAMTASLAACGSSSSGSGSAGSDGTYTIGICQQMEHPALDAATEGFQDACKEKLGKDNVEFEVQNEQGEQIM